MPTRPLRHLFLLGLLLASAGATPVRPATVATPPLVFTERACTEGAGAARAGQPFDQDRYRYLLGEGPQFHYAAFTTVAAGYWHCWNAAHDGEKVPAAKEIRPVLQVNLWGQTTGANLDEVNAWTTELQLLDASGQVLARARPTSRLSADEQQWKRVCPQETCAWRGMNVYVFEFFYLSQVKQVAPKATSLKLIIQAGRGLESFTLDTDQFVPAAP